MRIQGKAKKRLRPAPGVTPRDALRYTEEALQHLKSAKGLLTLAGVANTLERVNFAISSCKGAVRNAEYRISRQQERDSQLSYVRNAGTCVGGEGE